MRIEQKKRAKGVHALDLSLDIVDGVGGFYLKGDGFTREGLDEDLHDGLGVLVLV